MKVLYIFVSLVVAIKAGYHEEVGIPLAARIKAYEDKIIAKGPNVDNRILGEVAPPNAHPYLAGLIIKLRSNLMSVCGSSLVTASRLLTAGHCVDGARSLEAVLGSQYLFYQGTRITTYKFTAHPRFNLRKSLDYDIAIVYLPRPVTFSASIQPISLPESQNEAETVGEWATAAGYGKTSDHAQVSNDAQISEVRLKIIPETSCSRSPGMNICTSGAGGVGTCQGDSGGPLVVDRHGKKMLVGITSYGAQLCGAGHPSAFTRVARFLEFIRLHL